MQKDSPTKFSHLTLSLHWLVGLTMIGLLGVGVYMAENEAYSFYPIHKSIGVLIVLIVIPRVIWRIMNGWPKPAGDYSAIEHNLAKVVHWVLILGTLLMPISGMMMSGLGGHGIDIFGWELMASHYDPETKEAIPVNATLAGIGYQAHGLIGWLLIGSLLLHIVGAFKHHIVDKDGTLKRMLGKLI